ncbi:hypothetical protein JXA88_18565 [Candidatus Fermentibacteria bacterium]|nr:hypothetical protein [Candidatus Fermentibacteria bacterium]
MRSPWSVVVISCCIGIVLLVSCGDSTDPTQEAEIDGTWTGTWQSSVFTQSGQFFATLLRQETSLGGKITIPGIGMQNADVQGSIHGNSVTFGDIAGRIEFSGTIDDNAGSGTYVYPEEGDHGSWEAERADGSADGSNGELDLSFGLGGIVVSDVRCEVQDLATLPDGKILVAGNGLDLYSTKGDFMVIRYTAEGALDASFGANGIASVSIDGSSAHGTNFAVGPSGMISLSGKTLQDQAMVRFQQDGALDDAFGVGGILITDLDTSGGENPLGVLLSGTLIVAGTKDGHLIVSAYDSTGEPEESFGGDGSVTIDLGLAFEVADLCVLPDQRIVVAGSADRAAWVVRFTAEGVVDSTFGAHGTAMIDMGDEFVVAKIVDQPDGRLVMTGFAGDMFSPVFVMLRLATDGSLDGAFGSAGLVHEPDAGQIALFEKVGFPAVQADGKIVVASVGNMIFSLYRYTENGSRDMEFGTMGIVTTDLGSTGGWDHARAVCIQPNGRIVAAGCAGSAETALARYWP